MPRSSPLSLQRMQYYTSGLFLIADALASLNPSSICYTINIIIIITSSMCDLIVIVISIIPSSHHRPCVTPNDGKDVAVGGGCKAVNSEASSEPLMPGDGSDVAVDEESIQKCTGLDYLAVQEESGHEQGCRGLREEE